MLWSCLNEWQSKKEKEKVQWNRGINWRVLQCDHELVTWRVQITSPSTRIWNIHNNLTDNNLTDNGIFCTKSEHYIKFLQFILTRQSVIAGQFPTESVIFVSFSSSLVLNEHFLKIGFLKFWLDVKMLRYNNAMA